jgi:hypothetical protein
MDQTWYADDAGAGGKFGTINRHFEKLKKSDNYGCFPIAFEEHRMSQENLPTAPETFETMNSDYRRQPLSQRFSVERKLKDIS